LTKVIKTVLLCILSIFLNVLQVIVWYMIYMLLIYEITKTSDSFIQGLVESIYLIMFLAANLYLAIINIKRENRKAFFIIHIPVTLLSVILLILMISMFYI
jgi:hypothetical protein